MRSQSVQTDTGAARLDDSTYRRETFRAYLLGTFGPRPLLRASALATFDQWHRRPRGFPRGWRGFEDRLGSRVAQVAISHTLRSSLSRVLDERTVHFTPTPPGDSSNRFVYAVESPLRVSTPRGTRLSAFNPVTEIVSGILVTSVRPGGLTVRGGMLAGLTGIAGESAWALVREFWPWRRRPPFI